jgi:hypothetical protein
LNLELLDERRFGSRVVHLHYRTKTWGAGLSATKCAAEALNGMERWRWTRLPMPIRTGRSPTW